MQSASYADQVQAMISENKIMIFSKDYCPFCHEVKKYLNDHGLKDQYTIIELDLVPNGDKIHQALKTISG